MHKTVIPAIAMLLLTACSDDLVTAENTGDMAAASETCRAAVAEQLSRERAALSMSSDAQKTAYDQRYHFCMVEKGYTLPAVTP